MAAKVFFSYSHDDEDLRDRLEKHLSLLKRQGHITSWHDKRIEAGSAIDEAIGEALEDADIVLLLVSASFIHSDYCFSREMHRALERHREGTARVIPIILQPCDWKSSELGELKALPKDAKPVTTWANQEEAFLSVAEGIRLAVVNGSRPPHPPSPEKHDPPTAAGREHEVIRSSNLRLRKTFTQLDRDNYLQSTFDYMARFFEGSADELEHRNEQIQTRFTRVDARCFTVEIYREGQRLSECAVTLGGEHLGSDSITYSSDTSRRSNSFNEAVRVEHDDQALFLKSLGMAGYGAQRDEQLSPQGAAELLWSMLIQRLQ